MTFEHDDESKPVSGWENLRTGEVDYFDGLPDDFADYLPQRAHIQGLYRLLIEMGKTKVEAFLGVTDKVIAAHEKFKEMNGEIEERDDGI